MSREQEEEQCSNRLKDLDKRLRELRKKRKLLDAEIAVHIANGGSGKNRVRGAELYDQERSLDWQFHCVELERKAASQALKRAKRGGKWVPQFDENWRALAGVKQRTDIYSSQIRWAGTDKHVHVGQTREVIRQAAYIGPHRLKCWAWDDVEMTHYQAINLDVDGTVSVEKCREILNGIDPAFLVGNELEPGVFSRPHLWINLAFPVKAAPKSKKDWYFRRLLEELCTVIAARFVQAGIECSADIKVVAKNPDHPGWGCFVGNQTAWNLRDLRAALGIPVNFWVTSEEINADVDGFNNFSRPVDFSAKIVDLHAAREVLRNARVNNSIPLAQQGDGRNHRIFNGLRIATYEYCNEKRSYVELMSFCEEVAQQLNAQESPSLDEREVKHIVRSVARFCTNKSFVKPKNRGAAADLVVGVKLKKERQKRGALYANAKKTQVNFERIQTAKSELGDSATKKGIAKLLELSLNTVKKYWDLDNVDHLEAVQEVAQMRVRKIAQLSDYREPTVGSGGVNQVPSEDVVMGVSHGSSAPGEYAEACVVNYPSLTEVGSEPAGETVWYDYDDIEREHRLTSISSYYKGLGAVRVSFESDDQIRARFVRLARLAGDLSSDSEDLPDVYEAAMYDELRELRRA